MPKYYWYKLCPVCDGQGRLLIREDVTNRRLYLHCEECEWGWLSPEQAHNPAAGFLTLNVEYADDDNPNWETIEKYGWSQYALHWYEEE